MVLLFLSLSFPCIGSCLLSTPPGNIPFGDFGVGGAKLPSMWLELQPQMSGVIALSVRLEKQ